VCPRPAFGDRFDDLTEYGIDALHLEGALGGDSLECLFRLLGLFGISRRLRRVPKGSFDIRLDRRNRRNERNRHFLRKDHRGN
jgi:hypothetical protein